MMDINASGTGGAEDNIIKDNDESEVADDNNLSQNLLNDTDTSSGLPGKKGSKIGGNSGQVATKESATLEGDTTSENNKAAIGRPSSKSTSKTMATSESGGLDQSADKRIRYDMHGNMITTTIGTFSVANRKTLIQKR